MDEVHHGGDGLPWGDAAVAAFADAGFRLGLTGTPYRHDKAPIPWVKYIKVSELDDGPGIVVPQYHYRYGDGLADKIVSPIDFTWIGGHVERSPDDGEEFTDGLPDVFDFDDDYSDITDKGVRLRMMNKRLAIALSSHNRALVEGEKSLVREVVNALSQRREVYEKSAAAIICDSFEQLIVIKRALESYGLDVRYTTYREASSDNVVKEFNEGQGDVLLSIKQLAEGVSIPRLQTLGLAMCITTQLFFTQVVGRLARMITGIPFYLQHGSVICMKDPRFVEYAEAFKNPDLDVLQRPVVRTEKVCPECHELVPISAKVCPHCGYIFGGGDPLPEKEELHDGETKAGGMTVDGKTFTAEEVAEIVEQIQASPLISSDPLFRSLPIETQIRAFNAAMNAYRN
jgi:superfamily II DNA or RNA helicase